MSGSRHRLVLAALAVAATCLSAPAAAQRLPQQQQHVPLRPVVRETPLTLGAIAHSAFGKIVSFDGTGFVLRLRSGRMLVVDDTAAVAAGRTSMPLFAGKLVVVAGALGPRGTFVAQTVTRMEHIDNQTRADR